ncbi:MAG: hypothetical protein Q9228_004910 [Teloschistes exilis]
MKRDFAKVLFSLLAASVSAFLGDNEQHLYGSSFGVLGQDATFDYMCVTKQFRKSLKLTSHSILGGGTAGLAIAGRLASNPGLSVAVIEAGGFYQIDNGNGSVIPGLAALQHIGSLPNDTQPLIDWDLVTVPQAVRALRPANS